MVVSKLTGRREDIYDAVLDQLFVHLQTYLRIGEKV